MGSKRHYAAPDGVDVEFETRLVKNIQAGVISDRHDTQEWVYRHKIGGEPTSMGGCDMRLKSERCSWALPLLAFGLTLVIWSLGGLSLKAQEMTRSDLVSSHWRQMT